VLADLWWRYSRIIQNIKIIAVAISVRTQTRLFQKVGFVTALVLQS
jgi:hypothetical protein